MKNFLLLSCLPFMKTDFIGKTKKTFNLISFLKLLDIKAIRLK